MAEHPLRYRLWPGDAAVERASTHWPVVTPPASLPGVIRSALFDDQSVGDHETRQSPSLAPEYDTLRRKIVENRVRLHPTQSGRDAISRALEGVPSDGEVWISSSVATPLRRLSPCVMEAVSRHARFVDRPTSRTVAVVLVHEWGFPHRERPQILHLASVHGWRVIDDCAHAFAYGLRLAADGATVVFSLPKFFSVRGGGFLACTELPAQPSQAIAPAGKLFRTVLTRSAAHVANWHRIDVLAKAFNLSSVDSLANDVIPQVYRLRVRRQFAAQTILRDLGIETTPPFYAGWLALPCHADLPHAYWTSLRVAFEQLRRGR